MTKTAATTIDRVKWAEGLILQLPANHDGRNSWLLNYGRSDEAMRLRQDRGLTWDDASARAVSQDQVK